MILCCFVFPHAYRSFKNYKIFNISTHTTLLLPSKILYTQPVQKIKNKNFIQPIYITFDLSLFPCVLRGLLYLCGCLYT
nr:MAG TPA: hypothetical protein [Caudoviricetes sp.]